MADARNGFPVASHEAARETETGGRTEAQRQLCLEEVRKSPGKTAAEIAAATGSDQHTPSRRLPELRKAGLVQNGRSRICTITRRLSITWFAAQEVKA